MRKISKEKYNHIKKLSTKEEYISALAIDQRGSLKKMINATEGGVDDIQAAVEEFKVAVSDELTPYASSILLDPEYGLPAAKARHENAGLLLAYEKTGYDATEEGRLPDLIDDMSVQVIKEKGGNAVKFLLYYDIDESDEINEQKHRFTERIGSECHGEDIPFFLEIVTYDSKIDDAKGKEYAAVKPRKVIDAMKEFSKERYHVDVLKVEVPVNMNFVEGYGEDVVHTKEEAQAFFKQQSESTDLPFIYLSAGVSAELFNETLKFAKDAGAEFHGVLCGRATWKDSVDEYVNGGEKQAREWLETQGVKNIEALNEVLKEVATPWTDLFEVIE
ncbi:MAG TPA: tagatose-bisphosphate aldolase [Alloiococcus sp.]|nr:tagatose-bisphosphate aldolase [Alloiococcus sp.]